MISEPDLLGGFIFFILCSEMGKHKAWETEGGIRSLCSVTRLGCHWDRRDAMGQIDWLLVSWAVFKKVREKRGGELHSGQEQLESFALK